MKLPWLLWAFLLLSTIAISVTKADCENPPTISNTDNNITCTSPYPQDTVVRYGCILGYNTAGTSRFYTCTGTTWTGGNIRCEEILCSHVDTPENGRLVNSPDNAVGTTIQFDCNEGHVMDGDSTMLCRIDGEWNPSSPPTCTPKDCGDFGSIQYADTFQDNSQTERNHYGSVVQVTCHEGNTLIGSPLVKCLSNGQWGTRPTCSVLPCPQYPNTNSPCISLSEYLGDFFFISCNDNISISSGPEVAECSSGQWDNTEMGCLCDCIFPDFDTAVIDFTNLNSHGNLAHATSLVWDCKTGATRSSSVSVDCIDGQLHEQHEGNDDIRIIANYTNPIDINEILHVLCILPSSVASTKASTETSVTDVKIDYTTRKKSIEKLNSGSLCRDYVYCFYFCLVQFLFFKL